jgi:hypothetical protein
MLQDLLYRLVTATAVRPPGSELAENDCDVRMGLEIIDLSSQLAGQPHIVRVLKGQKGALRRTNAGIPGSGRSLARLPEDPDPRFIRVKDFQAAVG